MGLLNFIYEIIKENHKFLQENAKNVYTEIIELVNDAIDLSFIVLKKFGTGEEAIKHPIIFFVLHVFLPMSYGIYTNLLLGNLPACFMELRLIHETLAKCYVAERMYSEQEKEGITKVELLEEYMKEERISITKLMETELGQEYAILWRELSQKWVHSSGVLRQILENFERSTSPPSWSIIIPMSYSEEDLDHLRELGTKVSEFRKLLWKVFQKELKDDV